MRLQKYLSQSGVCSRRRAEELILSGRVTVNGLPAVTGQNVEPGTDAVCVDGETVLPAREHTYIMLNKPRGCVTTLSDPQGRPTVAELIEDAGVRLFPVGRLDYMSEGLLILTDDGDAANHLAHPSHAVKKTYRVWVRGEEPAERANRLTAPVRYRGVDYRGAEVEILGASDRRARLNITVTDGKNREIRNMCAAVGLTVERLMRVRQGELELGDLSAGRWRRLSSAEIRYIRSL